MWIIKKITIRSGIHFYFKANPLAANKNRYWFMKNIGFVGSNMSYVIHWHRRHWLAFSLWLSSSRISISVGKNRFDTIIFGISLMPLFLCIFDNIVDQHYSLHRGPTFIIQLPSRMYVIIILGCFPSTLWRLALGCMIHSVVNLR